MYSPIAGSKVNSFLSASKSVGKHKKSSIDCATKQNAGSKSKELSGCKLCFLSPSTTFFDSALPDDVAGGDEDPDDYRNPGKCSDSFAQTHE